MNRAQSPALPPVPVPETTAVPTPPGPPKNEKSLRAQAEGMRDAEVERALRALARGESAEQVIAAMARGLTNKLIHSPSIELKRASAEGRHDALQIARQLLGLQHDADE